MRIALLHDRMDWHSRQLIAAFTQIGVTAIPSRLACCGFDTTRPHGLHIDGFADLPDAALVRLITGGSFEAVTLRLGVLHAMEELGVPCMNAAKAIERCTDKSTTSFLLMRNNIATPEAWAVQNSDAAYQIANRECVKGALVLKPLFGSQGRGLKLITVADDLPSPDLVAGVYYLQRFVGRSKPEYADTRVLVSQGTVVAAMVRRSQHWITNIKQGALPEIATLNARTADLAIAAAKATGAAIAGVDIVTTEGGADMVLEVNSMPGWSGLQQVTPFSIAGRLGEDFVAWARGRAG